MIDDIAGPAFPVRIDPTTGKMAWASGSEKLRQNVHVILGTRHGERPMLREFGSRLHSLVHEPNDLAMTDILKNHTQQALLRWEPRILALNIEVERSESEARMRIGYTHTNEAVGNELIVPIL
jgi:phage baseplate assembly protein W